jgi:acyl carrier protein
MTDQSQSIIDSLIVIVSEQSDCPATENSSLVNDLNLDSLDLVSVTIAIENQWPSIGEIEYDPATMETVRDLAAVVENRLKVDHA